PPPPVPDTHPAGAGTGAPHPLVATNAARKSKACPRPSAVLQLRAAIPYTAPVSTQLSLSPYTMLSLEHINLRRGTSLLLEDANFTLHQGQRVGLVGKNGSGKSSLFKLISGELDTDAGQLSRPTDWRLAMMAQEVPALPQPAIDYVL